MKMMLARSMCLRVYIKFQLVAIWRIHSAQEEIAEFIYDGTELMKPEVNWNQLFAGKSVRIRKSHTGVFMLPSTVDTFPSFALISIDHSSMQGIKGVNGSCLHLWSLCGLFHLTLCIHD